MNDTVEHCSLKIEKTLREDGKESYVVVDRDYKIVEPITLFLADIEDRGYAVSTIETYCNCLMHYFNWLNKVGLEFYQVKRRNIADWRRHLNKNNPSPTTVNKHLATLSSFYSYFEGIDGYIEANPLTIKLKQKKTYYTANKVYKSQIDTNFFRMKVKKKSLGIQGKDRLYPKEVQKLYDAIPELTVGEEVTVRNKLLFRILYETGFRIGETLGLRFSDVSQPDPTQKFGTISIVKHTPMYHPDHAIKTLERDVVVQMELIDAIEEYITFHRPESRYDTIFVSHAPRENGKYLAYSTAQSFFEQLSKKTGIDCHAHKLRHTHGTELEEAGYDQVYIQHRLGHSSILTTAKYMHPSLESQREKYEQAIEHRKGVILV